MVEAYAHTHDLLPHLHEELENLFPRAVAKEEEEEGEDATPCGFESRGEALGKATPTTKTAPTTAATTKTATTTAATTTTTTTTAVETSSGGNNPKEARTSEWLRGAPTKFRTNCADMALGTT